MNISKFHRSLMDINQPVAFKCKICGKNQYKAKYATNLFPEHKNLAKDCFTLDGGKSWICSECEKESVEPINILGRIYFKFYPYSYRYLDGRTAEIVLINQRHIPKVGCTKPKVGCAKPKVGCAKPKVGKWKSNLEKINEEDNDPDYGKYSHLSEQAANFMMNLDKNI